MGCESLITNALDAHPAVRVYPFCTSNSGYLTGLPRIQMPSTIMRKSLAFSPVILAIVLTVSPSVAQNAPNAPSRTSTASNPADTPAANAARQKESYDPLLDLPPLKREKVTLIGGVVVRLDEVMNHMVFQPFGTKQKMQVHFDTRTHFYLDGKPITEREVKQGQRIYLDTQLNGDRVFVKTIWIRTTAESGLGRGQIMDFDPGHRVVTVRDELSNQPLKLQLAPNATIRKGNQPVSESEVVQGGRFGI
jgi:hypothetical protein